MANNFLTPSYQLLRGRSLIAWVLVALLPIYSTAQIQIKTEEGFLSFVPYIISIALHIFIAGYWFEEMNGQAKPGRKVLAKSIDYIGLSFLIGLCFFSLMPSLLLFIIATSSVNMMGMIALLALSFITLVAALWFFARVLPAFVILARTGRGSIPEAWVLTKAVNKQMWLPVISILAFYCIVSFLGILLQTLSSLSLALYYAIYFVVGVISTPVVYVFIQATWQLANNKQIK
ncbi:hypothetical protein [Polycladidibacter stylochi]|uniref:hypothetical protein n=1 Tax=Polycladidibacter stylochi TaxID=1807766 RepID=UPI00082B021A|nr:hypothetical protein [Pseudovibrio stylochi]